MSGYEGVMKRIFFLISLVFFLSPPVAFGEEIIGTYGSWEAFTTKENKKLVCYMGSEPKKAVGKYKKRGKTFVLVTHRPAEKSTNVISVQAGYTYKKGSKVEVTIGKATFKLFVSDGYAFTYDAVDDNKVVQAMVRGVLMTISGISERNTLTKDTYFLNGFSAAYKAISKACKI